MDLMERRRMLLMMQKESDPWLYEYAILSKDSLLDYVRCGENATRISIFGNGQLAGQYTTYPVTTGYSFPVVKIPTGTQSITIKFSDQLTYLYSGTNSNVFWMKDEPYADGSTYAKYVAYEYYNAKNESEKTLAVPTGADSFVFFCRIVTNGQQGTAKQTSDFLGLSITFNS